MDHSWMSEIKQIFGVKDDVVNIVKKRRLT